MNRLKFEAICRMSKVVPIHREEIADHVILVADGWFQQHPQYPKPHYKTVWALGKTDTALEIARPLYFDGGIGSTTLEQRKAAALNDARAFARRVAARERTTGRGR